MFLWHAPWFHAHLSGIAIGMPPDGQRVGLIPEKIHELGDEGRRGNAQLSLPERRNDGNWQAASGVTAKPVLPSWQEII